MMAEQMQPEPEAPSAPAPPARRPSPIRYGLAFALVAALIALHPLVAISYDVLFAAQGGRGGPATPPEAMPVPRPLDWSDATVGLMTRIGTLAGPGVLGMQIALWAALLYLLLRMLNPTFRLTSGVDWDRTVLTRTYMHTPPLIKAFLIAVTAFVPGFAAWWAIALLLGESAWSLCLRLALVGSAAWVLFSRRGLAGDYESGSYEVSHERGTFWSLAARGAVAGALAGLVAGLGPTLSAQPWLAFYRSLGAVTEPNWWRMAGIVGALAAGLGFGWAGIAAALAPAGVAAAGRLRAALLPALVLALTLWVGRGVIPRVLDTRYDYTAGVDPSARLAQRAGVASTPQTVRTAYVYAPGAIRRVRTFSHSVSDIDASPEAARRIEAFLRTRRFTTALSDPAFKTLYDAAALQWDTAGCLRVAALNLVNCPDTTYLPLLLTGLQACAVTPAAVQFADRLADGRLFSFGDRDARALMGDIYAGLGERAKAEKWYRRSELPDWQVAARLAERVRFTEGRVTGRATAAGAPVAGVRVGVLPEPALEDQANAALSLTAVRPFWFRWVSAATTTDAAGRFSLERLPTGRYVLVVMPPGPSPAPPVGTSPGLLQIGADRPAVDVGDLALR